MDNPLWTDDLKTGIPVLDRQHKRIAACISRIHDLDNNQQLIAETIDEVLDYTITHFIFEEEFMASIGYERIEEHKELHSIFANRVIELKRRFDANHKISGELFALLQAWFVTHIKGNDMDLIRFIKDRATNTQEDVRMSVILDELTLSYNRRGFMIIGRHILNLCYRNHISLALLAFRIEGLKAIGLKHGKDAIEDILMSFGEQMRVVFRDSDISARISTNIFVVLLTNMDEEKMDIVLKRFGECVESHNQYEEEELHIKYNTHWIIRVLEEKTSFERLLQEINVDSMDEELA